MLRENRTAAKALFSLVRMPQSQHGSGKAIKHWRGSCSSPLGLWPLGVVLVFELLSGFLAIECPFDRDAISVGSPVPGEPTEIASRSIDRKSTRLNSSH